MKGKSKEQRRKFLSSTQEVLYQREFKHADKAYSELSQKRNRS